MSADFLPINNIFRVEVEKCGCNFGCIKTSLGLFKSLLLLNMVHQIATVYELHHKIQPTGSLKGRIKFSQKGRLKKILNIVVYLQNLELRLLNSFENRPILRHLLNLLSKQLKVVLFRDGKKRSV